MNGLQLLRDIVGRAPFWVLGDRRLMLESLDDVERELRHARQRVADIATSVAPTDALPSLIEAVSHFYYGDGAYKVKAPQLGTALKVAIAELWLRVWDEGAPSAADADLAEYVGWASLLDQLITLRFPFFATTDGFVELTCDGFVAHGSVRVTMEAMMVAFARRGESLRLAEKTTELFTQEPQRTLTGILKVVKGKAPADAEELAGTWLGTLQSREPTEFWTRLLSFIAVFVSLEGEVRTRGLHFADAIRFTDHLIAVSSGLDGPATSTIAKDLFWRRAWRAQVRDLDRLRTLLVERPILRSLRNPPQYVTSLPLIGDAINWFVESSVFRHPGGVSLPEHAFRRILSEPFEKDVTTALRSLGFQAGSVNEKGIWLLPDQRINLRETAGMVPPGEIDVLALHDELGCLVIECKVLARPMNPRALRNLIGKLGEDDTEAIRSKVSRKLAWCELGLAHRLGTSGGVALVVLDRSWPGGGVGSAVQVVPFEALISALTALVDDKPV